MMNNVAEKKLLKKSLIDMLMNSKLKSDFPKSYYYYYWHIIYRPYRECK